MPERRTLEVRTLARVEGEGALHVTLEGERVVELRLEIYEPPRFFETFLRGRSLAELPDLVARVCGICPAAYQMSAVHAVEGALGVTIDPRVRALRRLYYAGEWIESHVLHMVFLGAPDYLGLDDAFAVARTHRAEVERALRLRATGNRILELLGGRSVNPVGVCIGGFHRVPGRREMTELGERLRDAYGDAEALLRWIASLPVPRRPRDVELVALRHPDEYPMNEGRLVSTRGLDAPPAEFDRHFEQVQVPHSTALHCRRRQGGAYLAGPLARIHLNRDRLSPGAAAAFETLADRFDAPDPAASVFARGIEVLEALDVALGVADAYEPTDPPAAPWEPRAGVGHGATEAPRGTLHLEVATAADGTLERVKIIPPTAQNQAWIEEDLRALAPGALALDPAVARRRLEAAIRDYDPCISCATHFLRLEVERRSPPCESA